MKKSVLVLVIVLASITVGSAFAITIRLAGDVTVDGTLDVIGTITIPNPTIDNLQGQIINLGGTGGTTPINAATLDGLDSTDLAKSNQSCQAGQLVTGFDATGNEICKEIKLVRDLMNGLGQVQNSGLAERTSIAIGTDGNPVISYVDSDVLGLKVLHCTTPSCSFFDTPTTIETGTGNGVGQSSSIAIGSDTFPVIVYRDAANFDLKLVHCRNISCSSFDTPIVLEDANGSTTFIGDASIAIGMDGNPVVAYAITGTSNEIRFIHCPNVSCSPPDAFQTLDTSTVDFPSIAIGNDNNPIVSYIGSSDSLKVAHCANTTCTSTITVTTIEDPVGEFSNTDIAIGSDTFPVIFYVGQPGYKFVHCSNVTCSSPDTPIIISTSTNDLGEAPPIVIGSTGFPVLALTLAGVGGELTIAYCKDVSCSNFDIVDTINNNAKAISLVIGNDGLPVLPSYGPNNNLQVTRAGGILLDGTVIPGG